MPNVKCQMPNWGRGYTLIEILVGLTIIGLLFGFGFASFREFSRRQAVNGTGKLVEGDLRLAQSQALSGQKPDGCGSLNGYQFKVESSKKYTIYAHCGGSTVAVKTVNLSENITVSSPTPNPIEFKVLGQGTNIPSGETVITVSQTGTSNSIKITINSSGEIK